jgi:hypothetical protein
MVVFNRSPFHYIITLKTTHMFVFCQLFPLQKQVLTSQVSIAVLLSEELYTHAMCFKLYHFIKRIKIADTHDVMSRQHF